MTKETGVAGQVQAADGGDRHVSGELTHGVHDQVATLASQPAGQSV